MTSPAKASIAPLLPRVCSDNRNAPAESTPAAPPPDLPNFLAAMTVQSPAAILPGFIKPVSIEHSAQMPSIYVIPIAAALRSAPSSAAQKPLFTVNTVSRRQNAAPQHITALKNTARNITQSPPFPALTAAADMKYAAPAARERACTVHFFPKSFTNSAVTAAAASSAISFHSLSAAADAANIPKSTAAAERGPPAAAREAPKGAVPPPIFIPDTAKPAAAHKTAETAIALPRSFSAGSCASGDISSVHSAFVIIFYPSFLFSVFHTNL